MSARPSATSRTAAAGVVEPSHPSLRTEHPSLADTMARRDRFCAASRPTRPRSTPGIAGGRVYPLRPMTATRRPDILARERAHELIRAWDGRPGPLGSLLGRVTAVDQVGVEERVDALKRRSIKKASKLWALDLAIRMMDLTTLEGKDTPGKIRALCVKAMRPQPGDPTIPSRRRGVRLPGARRRGEGRAQGLDRQGRQRRDRLPVGPDVPRHQARRDRARPSRPAPTRSTWSSTAARSCRATT